MEEIGFIRQRTKIHGRNKEEKMMVASAESYKFVLQNFEVTGLIPIEYSPSGGKVAENPSIKRFKSADVKEDDRKMELGESAVADEPESKAKGLREGEGKAEIPIVIDTCSSLKTKAETMEISAIATSSGCASLSEEACNDGKMSAGVSPLKRSRLEIKLSKQMTLDKVPVNVKDHLYTGLLEGVHVRYLFWNKKENWLEFHDSRDGNLNNRNSGPPEPYWAEPDADISFSDSPQFGHKRHLENWLDFHDSRDENFNNRNSGPPEPYWVEPIAERCFSDSPQFGHKRHLKNWSDFHDSRDGNFNNRNSGPPEPYWAVKWLHLFS